MRLIDELAVPLDVEFSISDFFDEMELPNAEKEKRKQFTEDFLEAVLFIFALFSVMQEYNYIKTDFIANQLQSKYLELVRKHGIDIDNRIKAYINDFSEEIVNVTERHMDEEYFLSQYRATIISVNEAQTALGYSELSEAIKKGYTKKKWITERDKKVRKTHREIDGLTIDISEPFLVGDSLMMYAHDGVTFGADAKELCGCRCVTKFIK